MDQRTPFFLFSKVWLYNHESKVLTFCWVFNWNQLAVHCSVECTVVELSTRTAFLNIDKSLQFRNFWSQSKAFFMIRCMLSDGSGFKTFGALKVTICVNFLEHSVYKICNFLRISACQWTMPSGLFAKKSHTKIFCSC